MPMKYIRSVKMISRSVALLGLALVFAVSTVAAPSQAVAQPSMQDQIRALERENAQNRSMLSDLMEVATSYENAIEELQKQINQLQQQINENEAQKGKLEAEIVQLENDLNLQRRVLGENIKAMYVGGEMTTIEMLATSKDLSDFVDKETYRSAVQRKIQDTMERIELLQNQLFEKKQEIEALLQSLRAKRETVSRARAEQASLLAMNQQQQSEFNRKTRNNQEKIAELQRKIEEQRHLNSRTTYTDGGIYFIRFPGQVNDFNPNNYEYKHYGFSMRSEGCGYYDPNTGQTDSVDRWGYCTRQCVSFTAWAVLASGRSAPMYYGNAKNWVNEAPESYIYRTPKVGDIAITTGGTYGHAMYVSEVSGNQFKVWEYNQRLDGQLRTDRWLTL